MPSEFQGPFSGHEYELYRSEQPQSTTSALTSRQRKIDPMGMMGKIFASLGAILVVIGVLVASFLGSFEPRGFGFFFAILAGVWGTGLLFLLLGLVLLLFFRNVRSAVVVDHYFMALINQDYPAAFQYLDPGMMTQQNELDAQTRFTQRAQAYDEQGRISDYALRGFSLNPWSARYTIKMRRGTGPYIVHLFLLKRGDTWKITGFDRF
ncbi:MAG: hypothetical protein ABI456_23995 [Ktedonobacteraceae bacterium]|nr:hypothetical protein [Chloroflexota bacterium]